MITLIKYGALGGGEKYNANIMYIDGLSGDTKPTGTFEGTPIPNASVYTEIDTGKEYTYDSVGAQWYETTTSGGGGGGGTTNYAALSNKPQINGTTLSGNKTSADLGLQGALTQTQLGAVNSGVTANSMNVLEDILDSGEKNIIFNGCQSYTSGSFTCTVNANGSITLNGTVPNTMSFLFTNLFTGAKTIDGAYDNVLHFPQGNYRIAKSSREADVYLQIIAYNTSSSVSALTLTDEGDGSKSFTVDNTYAYNFARIRIIAGKSFSNFTFMPFVCTEDAWLVSKTVTPYRMTTDEITSVLNGKQNTIDSSHKLSADNVDDTNTTNKFATAAQLAQITTNENNISYLGSTIYPQNIYDQTKAVNGERLQQNGGTYETEDYYTSDYTDVSFVGNDKLYWGTGQYGVNVVGVAFYDSNKNLLSYSSTVQNNIQNNTSAKYMRFSMDSQYYPANRNIHVSYGSSRAADYTPYFEPHLSRFDPDFFQNISVCNDYVYTGYGNNGSMPVFDFSGGSKVRVTVGHIITLSSQLTGNLQITKYNSNPETFELTANKTLVFDRADDQLKVVDNTDTADSDNYIIMLVTGQQGQLYGGMWFGCAMWQMIGAEYKEKPLPYSPRPYTIEQNTDAGDQSLCIVGNWLVGMDGQDSSAYIRILDKSTKTLIKKITHTLGHANNLSYCAETDSLLISDSDTSYILENAASTLENASSLAPTDCITINENLGVFVTSTETISCEIGTYDTINNTVFKSYTIGYNSGYTGTYNLQKSYTANYRMPVTQDMKWYDGALYLSCGYNKVVIYKVQPYENSSFVIVDSYNIINSTYEQEGISIENGNIILSVRETADMTKKYFITTSL